MSEKFIGFVDFGHRNDNTLKGMRGNIGRDEAVNFLIGLLHASGDIIMQEMRQ